MNKIMLIGYLTADPEPKSTANGLSVCSFRIAVERRFKDSDGNRATDFIPVTCWRQLAELCARYLVKGSKVGVVGTLQMRNYEDKQGNKRTAYEVVADEVEFLTPKNNGSQRSDADDSGSSEPPDANGFEGVDDSASLPF